jgi:Flp pilus assembly protein TadG
MEHQCSKQRTGRPYAAYRRAERGQSLVFIALVLAFLTPFIFTVIEFSERQMEVAQMEDALQQSIRSAVQSFDYAHLARNGQRIDQQRALQTARETFVQNLSAVSGLAERPEALAARVTWRVLPEGGTCSFSDGQAQTFDRPAMCAEYAR